jgi:DMSO reductase anchor subunit
MRSDALPVDHFSLAPGHAHPPLTVMLVLTQLAVGAFVCGLLVDGFASPVLAATIRPFEATSAFAVGLLALAASTLHLGRPRYAWRAVIGLRHSWLSREIVSFSAFAGLAALYASLVALDAPADLTREVGGVAACVGVFGVVCSVMIYAVTARRWWRVSHSGPKFALTTVLTGTSAVIVAALVASAVETSARDTGSIVFTDLVRPLALVMLASASAKLAGEAAMFRHLRDDTYTDLRRTAMLLRGDLAKVTVWRYATGIFGGVFAPLVLLAIVSSHPTSLGPALALSIAALVAVTAG